MRHWSLLALALVLSPGAARAEERPKIAFRLEYAGAEGCPEPDELGLILAAEFGYLLVRDDASARLAIQVQRSGRTYTAQLIARDADGAERWSKRVQNANTCHELVYDVAVDVRAALGPLGWGSRVPPQWLAAPVDALSVARPVIDLPRRYEPRSLALLAPPISLVMAEPVSTSEERTLKPEAAIGAAVSPYGMPKVGLGGNVMMGLRWSPFSVYLDIRGLITPASGVGGIPGHTSLWTFSLLPCASISVIDVCAIASASWMRFDVADYAIRHADGSSGGFGARVAGRWQFADRFALVPYADGTAELRPLVLRSSASAIPGGPPDYWRSPQLRLTLGVALAATIGR